MGTTTKQDLAGKDLLKAVENENLSLKVKIIQIKNCLKKGADINYKDKGGDSALLIAVRNQDKELMKFLLDCKGINVDLQNNQGISALMLAAQISNKIESAELTQMLIDKGANLNLKVKGQDQRTAISFALDHYNEKTAVVLINSGRLNVDDAIIKDYYSGKETTALMYAVEKGRPSVVKQLLDKGADVNIRDNKEGHTALIEAIKMKNLYKMEEEEAKNATKKERESKIYPQKKPETYDKIIDILLAHPNINVNLEKNDNLSIINREKMNALNTNRITLETAIKLCGKNNDVTTAKKLIEHGANLSIPDLNDDDIQKARENESSPNNMKLIEACRNNDINTVKSLLNNPKININYIVTNQETGEKENPLMIACRNGNKEIAKLLLKQKNIAVDFYSSKKYIKLDNDKLLMTTNLLYTIKDKEILDLLKERGINLKHSHNKKYYDYLGIPTEKTKLNIAETKQDNQTTTRRNSNQSFSKDLGDAINAFEQQRELGQ